MAVVEPTVECRRSPSASASRDWQLWTLRLSIVIPAAALALGGWMRRWVAEDGFITLRVVNQLLAGHGPVFNAGERVEAATSPAWMFLLAGLRRVVPIPVEYLAVAAGLVAATAGLLFGSWAAGRVWSERKQPTGSRRLEASFFLPLGALVVVVVSPFRDFVTSGLETGLVFGWLGASAAVLARRVEPREDRARSRSWTAAVLLGFGPLIRPDLLLFSACFLAALVLLEDGSPRRKAGLVGAALALPAAYQVFRMGYYAALVPNPALAKEAAAARWSQGMHYLGNLVGPYRLVVPLATGAAALAALAARAARHRSRRVLVAALAPVAGGILHGLYIVRVGGDFMHGRLLLPALFGCLTPVLVVPVRRWTIGAAVAITAAWSALCVAAFSSPGPGNGIVDERAFWEAGAGGHQLVRVGDYAMFPHYKQGRLVRVRLDQGGSGFAVRRDPRFSDYAFLPFQSQAPARVGIEEAHVGVVGMVAGPDAYVLDVLGLADPMAARIHLATRLRPGHEKHLDRAWIWARLVAADAPSIPTGPTPEAVATANQALRCPPLHRLMVAVRAPLTPGRFVHNVVDSLALHRLRFDNDPVPARQQLCR